MIIIIVTAVETSNLTCIIFITKIMVPSCIIGKLNITLWKSTERQSTVHSHSHKVGSTIKEQCRNISFKRQMSARMLTCCLTIYPLKSHFHRLQICGSHSGDMNITVFWNVMPYSLLDCCLPTKLQRHMLEDSNLRFHGYYHECHHDFF
jgi:hypothetical protein